MIPLSLYVTLEVCKIIQVYHIHNNVDLYDPVMDKRTECRALNITEELGQIQYIFSDKTGTLTENRMIFRHCAIGGVDYNHPELENDTKNSGTNKQQISVIVNSQLLNDLHQNGILSEQIYTTRSNHQARIQEFLLLLAVCNTVVCSQHPHYDLMNASGIIESNIYEKNNSKSERASNNMESTNSSSQSNDKYTRLEESRSVTPSPPLNPYVQDARTRNNPHVPSLSTIVDTSPISESVQSQNSSSSKGARPKLLHIPPLPFLTKRCTSNSNLTDEQKVKLNSSTPSPYEMKPIYEAESPDELALVDAAYMYGCRLIKRTPTQVSVELPAEDGNLTFDILNILPFDSIRKRMSVIVKHPITNEIILYCKGADTTVLPHVANCADDSEQCLILNKTQQHLNAYAREGLRVLVMAKRILTAHEYAEWYRKHQDVELSVDNVEKKFVTVFLVLNAILHCWVLLELKIVYKMVYLKHCPHYYRLEL